MDVRHTIRYRLEVDKMFKSVFNWTQADRFNPVMAKHPVRNYACLKVLVQTWERNCGYWEDYASSLMQGLVNFCETSTLANQIRKYNEIEDKCFPFKLAREQGKLKLPPM